MESFRRKLSEKDKRRIKKNKAIKRYQMVKNTIGKDGKQQVFLDHDL